VPDDAPVEVVIEQAYRLLGQAPCAIVTATLDDALAVEKRPNMPGTMGEVPNWSLALPVPLEEFGTLPLPGAISAAFSERAGAPSANT
jgi:4-alpha-glucanotransferase